MNISKTETGVTIEMTDNEAAILEMLLASTEMDHLTFENDEEQRIIHEIADAALGGKIRDPE